MCSSDLCYLSDNFTVQQDDVLLDVGSAEGIFALTHIEKLKHVVLFERNAQWVEALEATFAPWKEKVTIIRKYVSDCDDRFERAGKTVLTQFSVVGAWEGLRSKWILISPDGKRMTHEFVQRLYSAAD